MRSGLRCGFTWIEFAILLAVLAVVVAIAMPQYGDYTHRNQMSEAVLLLGSARTEAAVYRREHGKWPQSLEPLLKERDGKYTESVVISRGAGGTGEFELTATLRRKGVHEKVAGKSVRAWSRDGGQTWACGPGTAEAKYLPGSCRP